MFGLKIFVGVQTFRRGPPVPPHNFCYPGCICKGKSSKMHMFIVNVLFCYIVVAAVLSPVWWVLCLYFFCLLFCLYFFMYTFFVFGLLCSFFVFVCYCVYTFVFVLLCLERWAAHALEATAATTLTNSLLVAVVLIFNDLLYIQKNNFDWHSWKSGSFHFIQMIYNNCCQSRSAYICYIFLLSLLEI